MHFTTALYRLIAGRKTELEYVIAVQKNTTKRLKQSWQSIDNRKAGEGMSKDMDMNKKKGKPMELSDLVGHHLLTGVDNDREEIKREYEDTFDDCEVMRLCLDGVVYCAIEDPEDGYRSSMKELKILDNAQMSNVFEPVAVVGVHRTEGRGYEEDDVLELIDAYTGKVVVQVGTKNTNDYYPYFVNSFHPENMRINQ